MIEPAVERLGCKSIIRNAAPGTIISGHMPVNSLSTRLPILVSAVAMNSITENFAISEGCMLSGPMYSQRREPLTSLPMPGIATSASSTKLITSIPPTMYGFFSLQYGKLAKAVIAIAPMPTPINCFSTVSNGLPSCCAP